jgi:SAM-dependent methyltransferase
VTRDERPAPFDAAAAGYDAAFTETALGHLLRARVWSWLDRSFSIGDRVLELGCGTGADAVHLAERGVAVTATDASQAMLEIARGRVIASHANDLVALEPLEMAALSPDVVRNRWPERFDGAFSSMGAINCVEDRSPVARAIAAAVRPGGVVVLVVMAPVAPWEIGWHLAHGEPRSAFRRFRHGAAAPLGPSARIRVWYPSIRRLRRELAPWFRPIRQGAVGVALPPAGLSLAMDRRHRLLERLLPLERGLARCAVSAWACDHYVLELVRV